MKKFVCSLMVMFACVGIFAQQPVVAVAPFDVISNAVTAEQANMITDVFFVRLGNTRAVNLVNRNIVERVIREHRFQVEDWSNENKTAELARALNADWIVQGNIRITDNLLLIIVQFYDIRTFEYKGGADIRLANVNEAYDKINPLVESLIQTIGGGSGVRPSTPAAANRTYKVGDTGPAGGIIFYDRGFSADGWRYLEAAPTDFTTQWGAYGQDVAGTDTVVGSGKRNTQLIVDRLKQLGESNRAAQICSIMDVNGYKDWFLPSKDELDLMYKNLKQKGLGGFSNNFYWSSSQYYNNYAWCQRFSDGDQDVDSKDYTLSVRAVRAF